MQTIETKQFEITFGINQKKIKNFKWEDKSNLQKNTLLVRCKLEAKFR